MRKRIKPGESLPEVRVPRSLSSRLGAGHPWVYRDQASASRPLEMGTWVRVRSEGFSGYGVWDDDSAIAVRIFPAKRPPDAAWVREQVTRAYDARAPLRRAGVTAFRVLFGEGDGLPGVTVDYYDGYCLLVTYSAAVRSIANWVVSALAEIESVRGVVQRNESRPGELRVLHGVAPPPDLRINEYGVLLHADLARGQKTGLFLDHRENRRFIAELAQGSRVLNLFCYTGAFSLAALAGGARHVTSVDSAQPALEAAKANFLLNGCDPGVHEFVRADVFEHLARLREAHERFDLVICDPPSFAKRSEQQKAALKAYRRLTVSGLRVTEPGGLYAAASCTSVVSPEQFRRMLGEAAARANVDFQILHEAGQPLDHPVMVAHPEGRYLKFVVGRVLPRT